MASVKAVYEGMGIFGQYVDNVDDDTYIDIHHDEIRCRVDRDVGAKDVARLNQAGWKYIESLQAWRLFA